MSHQVKLSTLVFTDLDLLRQAVQAEGLTIESHMDGYSHTWTAGEEYGTHRVLEFGIKLPSGQCPCGIVRNSDGTYDLVGDEWQVSYGGRSGLAELSSRLAQRYRILEVTRAAEQHGLELLEQPERLLSSSAPLTTELCLVFRPRQRQLQTAVL